MEHNQFVRVMIIGAFVLMTWLFFPFLKSFFVAFLLLTAFAPLQNVVEYQLIKIRWMRPYRELLGASLITLLLFFVLFVPILFFVYYVASHPSELKEIALTYQMQIMKLLSHLPSSFDWMREIVITLIHKASEYQTQIISTLAVSVGNGILGFLGALGEMIMIVIFFFFLALFRRPITLAIAPVIPVRRRIRQEFVQDMIATTATGFYSLIGVAVAQGLAFGIFISFFHLYDPWLFGLMIAVTSVIPIVGTALIWIPVALNEFINGHNLNAVVILIYSWAMLSFFIDNIVRLIILQQINKLFSHGRQTINDFLIFFALIAGLTTFGFWGFLLGPAIVAFVVTLLRMLRRNHVSRVKTSEPELRRADDLILLSRK
ncbi:MAG: AI-2E family transporter [Sulfuricurvum sp.]|nr:AI-2E family transporter [Sulfuricurvum sp.]